MDLIQTIGFYRELGIAFHIYRRHDGMYLLRRTDMGGKIQPDRLYVYSWQAIKAAHDEINNLRSI